MYETESTQGDHKPTQIEKSKTAAGMVYECGGFPVLSHFLNKQTEELQATNREELKLNEDVVINVEQSVRLALNVFYVVSVRNLDKADFRSDFTGKSCKLNKCAADKEY